ncbi:MAG TPA: hypothetical protein VFY06_02925 [Verrucomicrobiae bacterium]|nr:hypothetical protein [Verrucomicrobiae bacterium]
MKTIPFLAAALLLATVGYSQPAPGGPRPPLPPPAISLDGPPAAMPPREAVNYLVRVEWKSPKEDTKSLEVLTTEGRFSLDTIQKNTVKINDNDVPVTLRFNGTLNAINHEKGRLQLFLGRTIPYVTGTSGSGPVARSTYQQMSVGLDSTFIVTFGKPQVIQSDENGQITVLVKRMED